MAGLSGGIPISWTGIYGANNTAAQMLSDIPFTTFEALQTQPLDLQVASLEQQIAALQKQDQAWTLLQQDANAFGQSVQALGASSAWDAMQATSGSPEVAGAAADASAVAGTYQIGVQALALQEIDGMAPSVALTSTTEALGTLNLAFTAATLAFTVGGQSYSVAVTASTSLASAAAAINATGAPVAAAVVTTGGASPGSYLEIVGTQPDQPIAYGGSTSMAASGDWQALGILAASGSVAVVQAAEPAVVTLGGASVSSATNTVSTLIPGVTLTLTGTGSTVITVSPDTGASEAAVQSWVADWNQWVNDTYSVAWGPMPGSGASTNPYQVLTSDQPMMTLNDLANTLSGFQLAGESLGVLGVSWSGGTSGIPTLQVTSASLSAALAAAPASVAAFFSALGSVANAWATGFASGTDSTTGTTLANLSHEQAHLQQTITQDNQAISQIEQAARMQYLTWSTQLSDLAAQENQTNAILGSNNSSTPGG